MFDQWRLRLWVISSLLVIEYSRRLVSLDLLADVVVIDDIEVEDLIWRGVDLLSAGRIPEASVGTILIHLLERRIAKSCVVWGLVVLRIVVDTIGLVLVECRVGVHTATEMV